MIQQTPLFRFPRFFTEHVRRADSFAFAAHAAVGQVRKYTKDPYIIHPRNVALTVAGLPTATEDMVVAALLHDVVEDTQITMGDIHVVFGLHVARIVRGLTAVEVEGNRAVRKAAEVVRLSHQSAEVQTIKYADLIDNTESIVEHDPDFASVYLVEKRAALEAMDKGDPSLRSEAFRVLDAAEQHLHEHIASGSSR